MSYLNDFTDVLFYFISYFIISCFRFSGLCTLVGIILYIGSITGEVGNKPRASIEVPKFEYEYMSSFYMSVGSFVMTELSGVFSVYLYISKHKHSQRVKRLVLNSDHNNDRANNGPTRSIRRVPRDNSRDRDRSHSRDRSRDPSASRSESYFTYTPISDSTSHELSNYTFTRENTNNTISTTAEMHPLRDNCAPNAHNASLPPPPPPPPPPASAQQQQPPSSSSSLTTATSATIPYVVRSSPPQPMPSLDIVRRTTPV